MAYTHYDRIGTGYDHTRQADAYLLGRLLMLLDLPPGSPVLDVGCGTGNYTTALQVLGMDMTGVDPSEKMLSKARTKHPDVSCRKGAAEDLPFPDGAFSGAIATLSTHHWTDLDQGVREVRRTLRKEAPFVLFLATPEQTSRYWLANYFPKAIQRSCEALPTIGATRNALEAAGFQIVTAESYDVRPTLQDLFLYAAKEDPARYLDAGFRKGISTFAALAEEDELEEGLDRLGRDIADGSWRSVRERYRHDGGDYLFLKAVATN